MRSACLFLSAALLLVPATAAAADDYTRVARPRAPDVEPGQVEIVEFFWYGCRHCHSFEPYLENWLAQAPSNVVFRRVPMLSRQKQWMLHGRAYFISQELDQLDRLHPEMFRTIHEEGKRIATRESLRAFYQRNGVAPERFDALYASEEVVARLEQAALWAKRLGVVSVPTIAVNGKYLVSARTAGSTERILDVVSALIRKESAAHRRRAQGADGAP